MLERLTTFGWVVWASVVFWSLVIGVYCANASPYVTCDCTPPGDAVTGFELEINGAAPVAIPTFTICETETPCVAPSYRICWDAVNLGLGPYSIKARARNIWEVSNWTLPLVGTKAAPSSPLLLKIIK